MSAPLIAMIPPVKPADLSVFLGQLLPAQGKYWMLMRRSGNGMAHEAFDDVDKMAARIRVLDSEGVEVWHACASYEHAPGDKRPGGFGLWGRKKDNVAFLSAFFLDIDVTENKAKKGYLTLEAAEAALSRFNDDFGVPCNYVVHSGGGLHAYWFLDVDVSRDEWERVAIKFKNATALAGLAADPSRTADSTSLLRPVGTSNRKLAYGSLGKPVEGLWVRCGRVSMAEFEAACDRVAARTTTESAAILSRGVHLAARPGASGLLAHLVETPKWFDRLDADTKREVLSSLLASLPEGDVADHANWIKVGAALGGVDGLPREDLFRLWAAWSQSTTTGAASWLQASEEDQRKRWESFNKSGVGALIVKAKAAGWSREALRDKSVAGSTYATVREAQESAPEQWSLDDATAYLRDNVIFVQGENQYLHIGMPVTKEALDTSLARYMPTGERAPRTASALFKSGAGAIVDYIGYKPGAARIYCDGARRIANTWREHVLVPIHPTVEDAKTFAEFIRHIGNDNDEAKTGIRRLFTKLSWLRNNPDRRIAHVTLLIGRNEGCGKTTLTLDIPRALFGSANVRAVEAKELNSDFNGYALSTRVLVLPELWLGSRKDAQTQANNLKPLITDSRISVVKKGKDGIDVENCTTIFANSNNSDAAVFGDRDRRYDVISTDAPRMPADLGDRVHELIRERPGQLLWLVLEYGKDSASFDPYAPPPRTRAKQQMLEAGRASWAESIRDGIQAREWPFNADVVAVSDIAAMLRAGTDHMPSEKAIREELLNCVDGAYSIQAQRRQGTTAQQKRVIVYRNMKLWKDQGPSAIYDHYDNHMKNRGSCSG